MYRHGGLGLSIFGRKWGSGEFFAANFNQTLVPFGREVDTAHPPPHVRIDLRPGVSRGHRGTCVLKPGQGLIFERVLRDETGTSAFETGKRRLMKYMHMYRMYL